MTPHRPALAHRVAGLAYGVLGGMAFGVTYGAGLIPTERQGAGGLPLVGLALVLVFAVLVYRGWWVLAGLLVLSNGWRAATYLALGLGWHLGRHGPTPLEPRPWALLPFVLLVAVVALLGRSAVTGYRERVQHPGGGADPDLPADPA